MTESRPADPFTVEDTALPVPESGRHPADLLDRIENQVAMAREALQAEHEGHLRVASWAIARTSVRLLDVIEHW